MNQRSTSVLKKMKTQFTDEHSFDKKIAKAIKDKKNVINRMVTPRSQCYRIPSYRGNQKHRQQDKQVNVSSIDLQTKQVKILKLNQTEVRDFCEHNNLMEGYCFNHSQKKGLFQQKGNRHHIYCHQCAIRMVKSNVKMFNLNTHSLILKSFLQEQFEKIAYEQKKARQMIDEYYQSMRQTFQNFYNQSLQNLNSGIPIVFGDYLSKDQYINKLTDQLGKIDEIHIRFLREDNKENINLNIDQAEKQEKIQYKTRHIKQKSMDVIAETNRSIESQNDKNLSFIVRSRQNSFYKKNEPLEIKKWVKMR